MSTALESGFLAVGFVMKRDDEVRTLAGFLLRASLLSGLSKLPTGTRPLRASERADKEMACGAC
jgi:hypothetical protein